MIINKDMGIRNAKIDDLPEIVRIYNSTIPGLMVTADTEPITVESRVEWFNYHTPDYRPVWVLEHNNSICGWLSFQSFYGRPAYNASVEMSIYIDENYRGMGVGSFLMGKALEFAPTVGIKNLIGFIFGHNSPSLKLFSKHGFVEWGRMPMIALLGGIERDLVIMGKRI